MEQIKHKTLPFERTVDIQSLIGRKVLTKDGKEIGKVKSFHVHPSDLTIEGIKVDPGLFEADHYIGGNYIQKMTEEAIILRMTPVTEYVGLVVHDSEGKKVGKVKAVNRSRKTNKLLSIAVDSNYHDEDLILSSDYISAVGQSVMLKEKMHDLMQTKKKDFIK
jgi:sporulation protein YlmC with PRC-barrel domain